MEKKNIRYGVVNEKKRTVFEKENQQPYGYKYLGTDLGKAVKICRSKNSRNWIVEKVYDTEKANNYREEIYRSGKFKE